MGRTRVQDVLIAAAVATWAALVAPGCSGDSDEQTATTAAGGSGGGGGSVTVSELQEYNAAMIRRFCESIMHCPIPNDDQLGARVQLETTERCETYLAEVYARWPAVADRYCGIF